MEQNLDLPLLSLSSWTQNEAMMEVIIFCMPARIRRFSSRWRFSGDNCSASDLEQFLPLVSGGGSDKLRVIDLAGALKAHGSLSPSPPMLSNGAVANVWSCCYLWLNGQGSLSICSIGIDYTVDGHGVSGGSW